MSMLFCPGMDNACLTQDKRMTIECKYCGCCDFAHIEVAKPPRAYKVECAHCGKFHKWASKLDVEVHSVEDILQQIKDFEYKAIKAAKIGDTKEYYKNIAMRDKYNERL